MNVKENALSGDAPRAGARTAVGDRSAWSSVAFWGVVVLVLAVIAVLVVRISEQAGGQPQTITVGEPQAGGEVALRVGDMFQVSLEGNPIISASSP
jgi:anti-sigma-K factor RskA